MSRSANGNASTKTSTKTKTSCSAVDTLPPMLLHRLRTQWLRWLLLPLTVWLLTMLPACGFQPRSSAPAYAFSTVAADIPRSAHTASALRQRMQAGGTVRFFPQTVPGGTAPATDVVLEVLRDSRGTVIRGQNADGEVRELTLVQWFDFRLLLPDGSVLLDTVRLTAERDTSYTEEQEVTRRDDREILYREMTDDLARQALHRLAAVQMPAAQ